MLAVDPLGVDLEKHLQTVAQLAGHEGRIDASHEAYGRIRVARVIGAAVPDAQPLERGRPESSPRYPVVQPRLVIVWVVEYLAAVGRMPLLREHGRQSLRWKLDQVWESQHAYLKRHGLLLPGESRRAR